MQYLIWKGVFMVIGERSRFGVEGVWPWILRSSIVFIALAMTPGIVLAQLPTATILGVVKDASGAVVPGVDLTARNVETGQTRMTVSAGNGSYRFPALPVGSYEVQAQHTGFQSEVRTGMTLTVGQEAVVNFTLNIGAVEQTVAVTAEAPLVDTTRGSLGGLVNEDRVMDLPLNGRNFVTLTLLQTGISQHKTASSTSNSLRGVLFSSNGAPFRSNNMMLDGAVMQDFSGATSASVSGSTLGVEGIREFRVVSNSFSAEYGVSMGSQMTIVSKGGTNTFHGSVFEFLRNDNLDARNFFDRQTALTPGRLPEFKRNNFGVSFGGPIKRDKTFFFGVYEGLRERLGTTNVTNTLPANAHIEGIANGGIVDTIAPVIKPLLAEYPLPNLSGNRLTFPFSQPTDENYWQARVDHTFSDNQSIFGRFTTDGASLTVPEDFPQFLRVGESRSIYTTLSHNYVISPTLLNTGRFSYSYTNVPFTSPTDLIGAQYSFIPGKPIGNIGISGVDEFGPSGSNPNTKRQNVLTFSDDIFYTRGSHSLKFGTLINRYVQFTANGSGTKGDIEFDDVRSFLLGLPTTYGGVSLGSNIDRTYGFTTVGFYAQDDWGVTPTLTLNLGLRYEFHTTYQELRGLGASLRDLRNDEFTTLGPPFENPSKKNFGPRLGFAWDVQGNGMTAIRGGFALLYDLASYGNALSSGAGSTPPFSGNSTVRATGPLVLPLVFPPGITGTKLRPLDWNMEQAHMMQYNLTVERQLPFDMAMTLAYAGSRGLNILMFQEGNPTVPEVRDGKYYWDANSCAVGVSSTAARPCKPRINPFWDTTELKTGAGNSWYNSMQFGVTKRLSKGLQLQSSYTWSKALDEGQAQLNVDQRASNAWSLIPQDRSVDKGRAAFDEEHNWNLNAIYRLPGMASSDGVAARLLNGWWVSSILSLQTGNPITPAVNRNRSRSGTGGGASRLDRPDLVPGRSFDNIVLGGPDQYFDPSAFSLQPFGFLGTAGRNIITGPGSANLDLSVAKDTALGFLGESGKLEFRAEFFNILNRANFATPENNRTVFTGSRATESPLANVGRIARTTTTSRQVQFALKVVF